MRSYLLVDIPEMIYLQSSEVWLKLAAGWRDQIKIICISSLLDVTKYVFKGMCSEWKDYFWNKTNIFLWNENDCMDLVWLALPLTF